MFGEFLHLDDKLIRQEDILYAYYQTEFDETESDTYDLIFVTCFNIMSIHNKNIDELKSCINTIENMSNLVQLVTGTYINIDKVSSFEYQSNTLNNKDIHMIIINWRDKKISAPSTFVVGGGKEIVDKLFSYIQERGY